MDYNTAVRLAKKYSKQYMTFWYVRKITDNDYQPWAHSSEDEATVATFYYGKPW